MFHDAQKDRYNFRIDNTGALLDRGEPKAMTGNDRELLANART
jgi:hypothetical protein